MSRLDTIVEGINIIENTDMGANNSALAIPLSFVAHNEILVRNAERALSQLASLDNTPVLVTKKTCRFFCPCCYGDDEAIRYDYCAPYDYCTKCGQRLDWGKREFIDERSY